ncbi:MAG: hypothetical protein ABSH01_20790 [Terriglobia bacterium]|jgi:hypothetical protein
MNSTESIQTGLDRFQRGSLVVGLVALTLCFAGAFHSPVQFFRSYLLAFVFWVGVALGCTAILMLHHMVGGRWGFLLRRLLESGTRTFYLMAVLALPLLFGLRLLYSWADPEKVRLDPILQYKQPYLNVPFFILRTVIYFIAWIALAYFLNKWSREQDETANPHLAKRLQNLSGPGMVIYGLTVTFASIDWVMSLEPRWFSTIYGMIFMVTQALAAMSIVTIAVILLSTQKPLSGLVSRRVLNDYGNLLLTFTMLWAYLSFSQYLIIWSGNLQEEIPWYVSRASGGWAWVAMALIVFHFAVPFLLLLSRFVTRRTLWLGIVAAIQIVMSVVDIFWLTVPAYERSGPQFHWMDWAAILGIGGVWIWRFTASLKGRPLLPLHDPGMEGVGHHA